MLKKPGHLAAFLVALSACTTVPLHPDRPELSTGSRAVVGAISLELVPLRTGHRTRPSCAPARVHSCFGTTQIVYGAYRVRHPRGTFLIDAGLSKHAAPELSGFPFKEREVLAHDEDPSLGDALRTVGDPHLDFVLLTHSHWDHSDELADPTNPHLLVGPGEADFSAHLETSASSILREVKLVRYDVSSFAWDGPGYEGFSASHDWFHDGSVVLVPLPGHTPGSVGSFLNSVHGRRLLFVDDTAWSTWCRGNTRRPAARGRPPGWE